ncbi:hypothetical protein scyTo_0018597 [Scyliorhinus torazame]|uniref:Uncharacterized protein n=1 Tax=Scyliorhinus torazame TaxID=75743 RepID=A0A401PZ10_SCYTO|nr:hypothetical protein [Scyliorhinus torazame]
MLAADLPFTLCPWIVSGNLLTSLLFFFQLSQGEVQKSGGRSALDAATGSCHEICSCRPPLLPPPPPPPPPPRQLATPN